MAENENLRIFEVVENNDTAFAPKQPLYQKVVWVWRTQKCNRLFSGMNALGFTARKLTRLHAPRIGLRMQIWEFSTLSKTILLPLLQSNVYIKR